MKRAPRRDFWEMTMTNPVFASKPARLFATLGALVMPVPVLAVDFGIFSDVSYSTSSDDDGPEGFALGQFDLFASHQIGERTRGFVEFVFESEDGEFVVDLERLSVQYAFTDTFSLAAGRFHTPIGYWNNVYHHGALLQDTVTRPSFIDFEDGDDAVLPMHTVGLLASGNLDSATAQIGYEFLIGNGASIDTSAAERVLDMNNTGDPDRSKALVLRVSYAPDGAPWSGGLFAMRDNIAESAAAGGVLERGETLVAQTIYGIDARFDNDSVDALAEVYVINNDNKTGFEEQHQARAAYVQAGYRFAPQWKAVARIEAVRSNDRDDYFILLGRADHDHRLVALRYDIDDSSAIKLEYDRAIPEIGDAESTFTAQWSFLIP
jgi:hypothetical protein